MGISIELYRARIGSDKLMSEENMKFHVLWSIPKKYIFRQSTPSVCTRLFVFDRNDIFKLGSMGAYKSLNHRVNCRMFSLCRDIQKNPGPTFMDPSKTVHAPYSQDFIGVFGPNAGQQCVAMSLCSLLYKYSKGSMKYSADLIMIMDIGNELYSMLRRLTGQIYLLLTELPEKLTVQDTNYELHFSESYTGQLHTLTLNHDNPCDTHGMCF